MLFARMRAADEDALICDFAETYHIYDYSALPISLAATLAAGLRDDSRSMMKINGQGLTTQEMTLISSLDTQNMIMWMLAQRWNKRKVRKPESIIEKILGKKKKKDNDTLSYASGADFEAARQRLIDKAVKKNGL